MKFAHLADTHLGYRQFGLIEREKDFYEVFGKVIDKIIEENVDFVIHSGDLFESTKPSPMALLEFQKGLLKLKGAGIPMYAIAGSHDEALHKGAIPPHVIFKKMGLKVISPINTNYMQGDIFIAGLPYYPASQINVLKSKMAELSKKAANHEKSILVLHQAINFDGTVNHELEIDDVPDNFNYYALGHIHRYLEKDFGKGKLVYPGSSEVWKTDELNDYKMNGKGFVVVDMDGQKPTVKRVAVDISRAFVQRSINFDSLDSNIAGLKETIKSFDKKPVLTLNVKNIDSDSASVYETIKKELEDLSLIIRPTFSRREDTIDEIINQNESISAEQLIEEKLLGYGNSEVDELALKLYDLLSKDKIDESQEILDQFFEKHYVSVDEEIEFTTENLESDDAEEEEIVEETPEEESNVQVTFKGGLE